MSVRWTDRDVSASHGDFGGQRPLSGSTKSIHFSILVGKDESNLGGSDQLWWLRQDT